ncbi:MAG: hypothetical protein ACTSYS_11290 [Promethearchaeota archaeon]
MENSDLSEKKIKVKDLWDEIGFFKLLAGFWYNLAYTLIGIGLSAFIMGTLMNVFYPFPESWGYRDVAYTTFALIFVVFDLGTASIMDRFLGEKNIKDPKTMLHYIQYFIWYQMITGLIQITGVSIYALFVAPNGNQGYAIWLMLVVGSTQYPGFLGVFRNVLGSLQQYNKTQTLNFFTGTLFQRLTEIVFLLIGRYYGATHPEIGEIMGIAIGSAIGLYVDDFFAMLVSAHFFSNTMKSYGIKPRNCFKVEFTWKEIKPVLIFAFKTGVPGLVGPALNLVNLILWLTYVPHYTTFIILAGIGGSIPGIMDWFGVPAVTPLISESYMNEKKRLTQYYIGQLVRFRALLHGFFVPLLLVVSAVIPIAWKVMHMDFYLLGVDFIIPYLILYTFNHYAAIPGQIMFGANKPNIAIILGFIGNIMQTIMIYLYLGVWRIHELFGFTAFVWIYTCGALPINLILTAISYSYIDKKIFKIKIPWKQITVGILIPAFLTFSLEFITKILVFDTLLYLYGFYVAAAAAVALLALLMIFCYFPLTGMLGGWDDINLNEFKKTALMSGPSRFIVLPLFWLLRKSCNASKLHGRFQMSIEGIEKDAEELLRIKRKNRNKLREELTGK